MVGFLKLPNEIFLLKYIKGVANDPSMNSLYKFCKDVSSDFVLFSCAYDEPPTDFPLSFLRSINMSIAVFKLRNDVSKIWILVSNRISFSLIISKTRNKRYF